MPGGAAAAGGAAGRSRPPLYRHIDGLPRYGVYSLFPAPLPTQQRQTTALQKVSESLFSSVSTFGVPTPPPGSPYSPLQLELLKSYSHQVLLEQKRDVLGKMDDPKLSKQCLSDSVTCCGLGNDAQRQMLENVTSIMQPLTIKTENLKRSCNTCITASPKKVVHGMDTGCSRTNPVAWATMGMAGGNVHVQVKREPHAHAHHVHMSDLVAVKLEQSSPGTKHDHQPQATIPASLNNGTIPVGIAVARQRVGDAGLLAALSSQKDQQHRLHDLEAAAMTVGVNAVGGALLHCDDRASNQLQGWPVTSHAPPQPSALAPPPTLWQYPAPVSMDSMMVSGVGGVGTMGTMGVGGGGFQLVRDPASGALILLPAPAEQYPQAVVWGGYPTAPLILPSQPQQPPLQLLGNCGDLLTSATLHQHTQTQHTRLVALAPPPQPPPPDKRKLLNLLGPHALIKIEAEHAPEKPPQPQFAPDPSLLATHLYYQQPPQPPPQPPFVQVSQEMCRSQATSPVACLTPPPEVAETQPSHRDASNQTDAHDDEDDDSPNQADDDESNVACVGVASSALSEDDSRDETASQDSEEMPQPAIVTVPTSEPSPNEEPATATVQNVADKAISMDGEDLLTDNNSSSIGSNDLVIDSGSVSPVSQKEPVAQRSAVDVSGLELLSNSIEQFEIRAGSDMPALELSQPLTVDTLALPSIIIKTSPKSPPRTVGLDRRFEFPSIQPMQAEEKTTPSLDGLGLLCALAEQRFMEEVEDGSSTQPRVHVKIEPQTLLSQRELYHVPTTKERRRTRDSQSPDRSDRKRHRDDDRSKYKFEKIRRHREERSRETATPTSVDKDVMESFRRVTACACSRDNCTHVPSAEFVSAIERDMRDRLAELQRQFDEKRAQLSALEPCAPSPTSSQSSSSPVEGGSSKKRKVGRPKKVSSPDSTETIVAKKPKSKSSLVGYLLAAKSRLNMPNKGGIIYSKGDDPSRARTSKVRPKLKAEPKVKDYSEEDDRDEWGSQSSLARSASSSMESLHEVRLKNREKTDRIALKLGQTEVSELEFATRRASVEGAQKKKKRRSSAKSPVQVPGTKPAAEFVCTLTEAALDTSPRVLTARGGLFYAGKLSAVQAPDVYAITLDGERGNKPHILSREETLRDAILEVTPSSTAALPPGTRLCAYWSQQYRCLYPGTVAPASPEPELDDKFVSVEFDDGDSGRIAIEDIRLLEPNYPVVEYDPNPLLTLGKRRRNTSVNSTEEKKTNPPSQSQPTDTVKPSTSEPAAVSEHKTSTERSPSESEDKHRDRKKLKKHRKEKLKRLLSGSHDENPDRLDYVKKKKKKHKCYDEHCKHRKHHKKHHRKHRKRHHSSCKEHSSSSSDDHNRHKSSSDGPDSHRSNEDSHDSNDQVSTLVAMEKSPTEDMKTVIKKTMVSKKSLVKNAVLDFSIKKKELAESSKKDNLKDSGICVDESSPPTDSFKKKSKKRTVSSTSSEGGGGTIGVSKMAAFLPGGALWSWHGSAYKRVAARPRHRKLFYRAIQRGDEVLKVGDAAVFLSTGRPDRPYIGRIVSLWEARGAAMAVKVKWFYHPEETTGFHNTLKYPGGLFESPHTDENDVQTISHKCEVLPLPQYKDRMGDDTQRYTSVYDNNDLYYLVGHYDPTQQTIKMQPDIPFAEPT